MSLAKRLAPPNVSIVAVLAVLALLTSLASAPGAQAAPAAERWSPIGPQGGTVTGVLKSTDGGRSWALLDVPILFECHPIDLAIDPHDPDTVFAATPSGLFETHDAGATWQVNPGQPAEAEQDGVAAVAFAPAIPGTLYIRTPGAAAGPVPGINPLFRSIDGGATGRTWNDASAGLPVVTVQSLALTERAPGSVFAGTSRGLFRRRGGVWSPYLPALFTTWTDLTVAPSDPAILYALLGQSGTTNRSRLFRSVDAGTTWRRVTEQGLPPGQEIGTIIVDPARPRVLYTLTRGGIYRLSRPPVP